MNGLKSISLSYGGSGKHSRCIGLVCSIIHLEMLESVGIYRVHPEESSFYSNTTFNSMVQFNTCIAEHWEGLKSCAQVMSYRMRSACICYWSVLMGAIRFWYTSPSHHVGGGQQKSGGPTPGEVLHTRLPTSLKFAEGISLSQVCPYLVYTDHFLLCMALLNKAFKDKRIPSSNWNNRGVWVGCVQLIPICWKIPF